MTNANGRLDLEPDFRPLAARMRPRRLDEYIGQSHLLAPGKPLYEAINRGLLHSMILWGPPGTGKTTLAEMVAHSAEATLDRISAVTAGVKDIRAAIDTAKQRAQSQQRRTVLFVDEVHRFNKSQQDAFLPHIEDGTIIFVGATTENPAFELNNALLSRTRVYRLKHLDDADIEHVLRQALEDTERGLGERRLQVADDAFNYLIYAAAGDARRALNFLEICADAAVSNQIKLELVQEAVGSRQAVFDKQGDAYYELLSALHKSVRGSSPDGALYWYARILQGGGDPLIVARRVLAIASEDIGNADPRAIQLALNAWDTFTRVGPAEGERAIAQALIFCAMAPKSNAVYNAFNQAKKLAEQYPDLPVPKHLTNAPTTLHKAEGYGVDYRYAHDYPHAFVAGERYLPSAIAEIQLYQPNDRGLEKQLQEKLNWMNLQHQTSSWQRGEDD
ncbi:replication-associated recombination protein A [Pseudidiomarina andamanensis]|uniref:Replication-associated recombination protein A n=1 Tax=Pseudidiomarina andamanensis TaxID=1940690 RepID=A0AA92EQZ3_9GAMM|nr:replication-associated recombination protein A [Pseudidiomarina andamanensis]MDS0218362.1 replication-associated recombination protein A [Pseudidiomarina andamanensis]QGT95247.1 replication-associated recombination protein A [Pseudidiomarina andamanensis]